MYFQITNAVPANEYKVFFTNHSPYYPAQFEVVFDSITWVMSGPCDLTLYILRNGSVKDSAVIRFTSRQTGLSVGNDPSIVPQNHFLFQNYPNPFNPTTEIQFTIVDRQWTIVKVYDVLGSEVATLVNEVKGPGTYTVQFDGSYLASGVYFYRLQAGDFTQAKRLMLLR
jgi:hypothetical protein